MAGTWVLLPEPRLSAPLLERRLIGAGAQAGTIRQSDNDYVDEEAVKGELLWARRLCNRNGWPVIDVTRRSIEETAATVLQLMEAWHERKKKQADVAKTETGVGSGYA